MQLHLPFLQPVAEQPPAPVVEPAAPQPEAIEFVRVRRARRYILRVRPDGTVRVTVPRGGSRREAEQFMRRHEKWIARERSRVRIEHAAPRWQDGTTILFDGEPSGMPHAQLSDDKSMAWVSLTGPGQYRTFYVFLWNGSGYDGVVDDQIGTPAP